MSNGSVAYLILVGCGFGAFMVTLAYGYIRCAMPERPKPAAAKREAAALRKAA